MLKLKASIVWRLILLALMNNESFERDMKMLYDIGLIDPKTGQLTELGHDASKTACDFFKTTVPGLHDILCLPLELERFTTIEFEHDWDDFNKKNSRRARRPNFRPRRRILRNASRSHGRC